MEQSMCVLKLPQKLDFDALFDCISNNHLSSTDTNVIDFSAVEFADPTGIAPLAAVARKWLGDGLELTFQPPSPTTGAFKYLQRVDFFRKFHVFEDEKFRRHNPQGNFCPLQEIAYDSPTENIATKLAGALTGNNPTFIHARSELYNCLYESMNNIKDHARLGNVAGYSLVQNYKLDYNNKEYVFTTADAGRGISESLRDNSELKIDNETTALNLACQPSISGSPGIEEYYGYPRNMGEGLTNIDRVVKLAKGYFRLISGSAERIRREDKVECRSCQYPWQGTIVIVKLTMAGMQQYLNEPKAIQQEDEVRFD